MRQILASLSALLVSMSLLMLGTGLFTTFIGLRAVLEGFTKESVGLMMSVFYLGLILGTLRCGRLINRIGHIRAFAVFSATSAAVVIVFPLFVSAPLWMLLRGILGFNLAGMYMVAESWLNTRATGDNRGTLLAIYTMTSFLAMGGGQLLINLGDPAGFELFIVVNLLFCLALVPVAVTRATHPAPVEFSHFRFRQLYAISPVSVGGCLCSGFALGALFGMGPIYGQDLGLSVAQISQFMSVLIVSGLFLQLPLGRLSDRLDRRWVIVAVASVMALAGFAMVLWAQHSFAVLLGLAAIFGGLLATLYPLSVAYANDYIDPKDMVPASGGLLLAYSVGAAVGPAIAAGVMRLTGPGGLFLYTGVAAAALVVFALYRMRQRHWAPVREKEAFVPLPVTDVQTSVVNEIDPRCEPPAHAEKEPPALPANSAPPAPTA